MAVNERAQSETILVIEDDNTARITLGQILEQMGRKVILSQNGEDGLEQLTAHPEVGLVLTDVVMPGIDGMEVLARIRHDHPGLPVIVMTAFSSVARAVHAMRLGAVDYLEKPLQLGELRNTVSRVLAHRAELIAENRGAGHSQHALGNIVGSSPAMHQVFSTILQVAPTRASVLLEGESGTGKELIAREIHKRSLRTGPLIAVHCASLSESLIESELFGHARGAYTGASSDRKGRFEEAHSGTLFLDEVSEIPRDIQVKLLRVLQEREVTRVGESRARPIDVRIISASNRDLKAEVASGQFREDLYFRINVVRVVVPPLRERKSDIPALVEAFLLEKSQINDRDVRSVAPHAMDLLMAYEWPGNVRELENVIENGVVMTRTHEITPELLPLDVQLAGHGSIPVRAIAPSGHFSAEVAAPGATGSEDAITIPIGTPLENVEREMILRTLAAVDGNKTTAARILGIGARTLYRKLEQYGEHTRNPDGESELDDLAEAEE